MTQASTCPAFSSPTLWMQGTSGLGLWWKRLHSRLDLLRQLEVPSCRLRRASSMKSFLENRKAAKYLLLFVIMLGTAMVIGDGILTPCISVLLAVGGIREAARSLGDDQIMWISVVILILLLQVQRFGTYKVGYSFASILSVWFLSIGLIGIYNFARHDLGVIRALNPLYIVQFFMKNKKEAWSSFGGVIRRITGSPNI
ncbi:potassium transporter 20-like [Rhodamnia argentea]|uniref:Potassium transporter 20-like n=1 Tax=Rhodamnia argentea TaxID=178133 RepID=A0A8B8QZW9_9MYRT|nr:potassium transporter 20-like [Rhodamnia argentea]